MKWCVVVVIFVVVVVHVVVVIVVVYPRNLPLKFGQNLGSNRWDIADVGFPVVVEGCGDGGDGGVGVKSFSCQTQLMLC